MELHYFASRYLQEVCLIHQFHTILLYSETPIQQLLPLDFQNFEIEYELLLQVPIYQPRRGRVGLERGAAGQDKGRKGGPAVKVLQRTLIFAQ